MKADSHGNITEDDWEFAHCICNFIFTTIPKLGTDIFEYFDGHKKLYPKDLALKNRLESLTEQYHLRTDKKGLVSQII